MDKLEIIRKKILDNTQIIKQLSIWRFLQQKIVFTNGCFDILHRGHIEYLANAASYGDIFIVGLNTDSSVRRIKGPSRPIQDQNTRALILASIHFVDVIIFFDEDTPYRLIETIQPDVLVKGADYNPEDIVGYDLVKAKGGEIVTIEFVEGYSTSSLLQKIASVK
jgi:rfaE bifunctional protein nucleotidyltransferase chain/domain